MSISRAITTDRDKEEVAAWREGGCVEEGAGGGARAGEEREPRHQQT